MTSPRYYKKVILSNITLQKLSNNYPIMILLGQGDTFETGVWYQMAQKMCQQEGCWHIIVYIVRISRIPGLAVVRL